MNRRSVFVGIACGAVVSAVIAGYHFGLVAFAGHLCADGYSPGSMGWHSCVGRTLTGEAVRL